MSNTNFIKAVSLDAGNGWIKICRGAQTRKIRSCIFELPSYQDEPENLKNDSVFLEYGDRRIIVGELALSMGGVPTYQIQKSEVTEILLMSAIEPTQGSKLPTEIDKLKLCTPDKRESKNISNLKALVGTRTYSRNGIDMTLKINSVTLIEEGLAAFNYAKNQNLFQFPDKLNAIADFGAGDTSLKLFTSTGENLRNAQIRLEGLYGLAKSIASYLLPKLGKSPDLVLIMDGISNETFRYGATDTTFKDEFDICHQQWIGSLKSKIKESWGQHFPQLGEVLLVGGAASLAMKLAATPNSRFKLAKNHQFINALGMTLEG